MLVCVVEHLDSLALGNFLYSPKDNPDNILEIAVRQNRRNDIIEMQMPLTSFQWRLEMD